MATPAQDGPTATLLPAAPSKDKLNKTQWEILYALLDGVLPSIASKSAAKDPNGQIVLSDAEFEKALEKMELLSKPPSRDVLRRYLEYRPALSEAFREDAWRFISASSAVDTLGGVLQLLSGHLGSLLLTGHWGPIHTQPTHVREKIMRNWNTSRFTTLRGLAKNIWAVAEKSNSVTNPIFAEISGYTDVPAGWKKVDGYDFNFIQVPAGSDQDPHVLETDVVIVGSSYGGSVSAKNIAEAGHRVLVVDKGYYFPPSQLPMTQGVGLNYLYERGGITAGEDGSSSTLSGAAWGGGGTVNWSVCLRTQDYVRKEWADGGLPMFTTREYDRCLDRVWSFVGADASGIRHNHRNRVLLEGSEKLGWRSAPAAQNTAGKEHYCGQCHLGCGSAEKRGPTVSWLPAAGEAGAKFMEGFKVEKVLFADDGETATGIEGVWVSRGPDGAVHSPASERTTRRVVVKAKKVVISGGTLRSPLVLMASGVKNAQLGKNLHLHPVNLVSATFREETRPWEGGIITSYNSEFENLDGKGHGVKLEPTAMLPYSCLALQHWKGGLESKMTHLKFKHMASFISLTRDRDTGSVFPDPKDGSARMNYTMSDFDCEHTMEGLIALSKLCYVSGATEIWPHLPGVRSFFPTPSEVNSVSQDGEGLATGKLAKTEDPEFSDPEFAKWIKHVRDVGNRPPITVVASAHQMGTCRMAATPEDGVVDSRGRVWDKKGLYVADASVFPSASGVNPMITVMAISDYISRCLLEDFTKGQ